MAVVAGRVYKRFVTTNGKRVTLRAARWEDLDDLMAFANGLVEEQTMDPSFGTLIDGPVTREEEAKWLANKLVSIENGREFSVAAEVDGKLVANSEVVRGGLHTTARHGTLGIAVSRGYRGIGIGERMMACLIDQSRKGGIKTLELHVLATNPRACALYSRLGFYHAGVVEKKIRRGGKSIDLVIMTMNL